MRTINIIGLILTFPLIVLSGSAQEIRPELVVQTGHANVVNSVAFSPDGKLLASGSDDETVKFWNVETGEQIRTLTGHSAFVNSVAFSPQGQILASASSDKTIKIWNIASGKEVLTLKGHAGFVNSIAFSPDGKTLASGSDDKTIKVWQVETGKDLRTLSSHSGDVAAVAFSSDGITIASGSGDKSVKLWNSTTGELLQTFAGLSGYIKSVAFSPDGTLVTDGEKSWEVVTGKEISSRSNGLPDSVSFSLDGKTLANAGGKLIELQDTKTNSEPRTFAGHTAGVNSVAFSPDGKILASGSDDKTIRLWDAASGARVIHHLDGHSDDVKAVAVSANGKLAATGSSDKTIKIWDTETGKELRTLTSKSFDGYTVAFSPDGKILASGGTPIKLWDVETGRDTGTLAGHTSLVLSIAFSPDGKTLASGGADNIVKVWNLETSKEVRSLKGHSDSVVFVAMSPDGKRIASGSWDRTIRLWDAETGKELRPAGGASSFYGMFNLGDAFAISPDSKILAASDSFGVKLLNIETGGIIKKIEDASVSRSIKFSPDGKMLAGGSRTRVGVWDIESGAALHVLTGHSKDVNSVAFSPDGMRLMSGSDDKTAKIWTLPRDSAVLEASTASRHTHSVEFSRDFQIMAIFGAGGWNTIALWDLKNGQRLADLVGTGQQIGGVAFHPSKPIVASVSWDSTIVMWDIRTSRQLEAKKFPTDGFMLAASLRFSNDGKHLLAGFPNGKYVFWNTESGKLEIKSTNPKFAEELAKNYPPEHLSNSFEVRRVVKIEGAKITLSHPETRKELFSLISFDGNEWLVTTPDGLFDGTPAAWKQLIWRFDNNTLSYAPVEAFFKEFYYPGLLQEIVQGKKPPLPKKDLSQVDIRQPQVKISEIANQPTGSGAVLSTDKRTVTVKVEISDNTNKPRRDSPYPASGASDLRLFRNGSLVKLWQKDVFELSEKEGCRQIPATTTNPRKAVCQTNLPIIAGKNNLTAYAFNHDDVKSSDATFVINGADSLKRPATAYILAIGVDSYSNSGYDLKYAVADAREFSAEVKRRQKALQRYAQVEVISLSNAEATKANIMQSLTGLTSSVQPEDAVIVYFAGHGMALENRFYLIPHDLGYTGPRARIDEAGLESMRAHSISDIELDQAFERIDSGQILLVIDACNSGQALEAAEKRRGPMNSKGLAQLAYEKGMYILTAAQSYQAAQEAAKLGHGFLTFALVEEGLKRGAADGEPKDGRIELREWLDYATDEVPRMQEENMLDALRGTGRLINFAGDGSEARGPGESSVQRPRIFYRREMESNPLVVAILGATSSNNLNKETPR